MSTARAGQPARRSRKSEILERFAEMVATRGYDETSIGDLALDLGLSKGTIVHHYGSKLALLEQLHREFMLRRLEEGEAILERLDRAADQLEAMIYCLLLVFREDRSASLAFTREIVRYASTPEMAEVRELRDEYFRLVRGIVERGMREGAFHVEDPTTVTLQIFGMCNWTWTWFRPDGSRSVEEIAAVFARTFLNGISVRRRARPALDDPNGPVPSLVRDLIRQSIAGRAKPGG